MRSRQTRGRCGGNCCDDLFSKMSCVAALSQQQNFSCQHGFPRRSPRKINSARHNLPQLQNPFYSFHRLLRPQLVGNQRKAHVTLAERPEANAR